MSVSNTTSKTHSPRRIAPLTCTATPRLRRDVTIGALIALLILVYTHLFHSNNNGAALLRFYDPERNSALHAARLSTRCEVKVPSNATIEKHRDWGVRLVSYLNIHRYLQQRWSPAPNSRLKVLGNERFLQPYTDFLEITKKYVDLHHIPYASESFDVVAADQVLEHVIFPQQVMLEIHRVLKPGGIAILTTIAYNPLHEGGKWHDYWRFMVDGMLTLSLPFKNVPLCGSWGNANAISSRATRGLGGDTKHPSFEENARVNEKINPFVVWMIVEK